MEGNVLWAAGALMATSGDLTWLLVCSVLVMLMQAGFLCLETGLTRSKNSINVAVKNLADLGVSMLTFWMLGYGLMFGLSQSGVIGSSEFLLDLGASAPGSTVFFFFQALFCGTAVTIMSGAVAGRLRFAWYLGLSTAVTAIVYPVFGHWAWNQDGWLAELGFVDFAGGTVVHSVGGWAGLAIILILGPRAGRFTSSGSQPITGSNLSFATLGALLLWVGWVGFNGGSLLRYDDRVVSVIANTAMAGAAGLVGSLVIRWFRDGAVRVTSPINGLLAGLVAVTSTANAISTLDAVVLGVTGALVCCWVESWLERRQIDDAVGAVPVHLGAGVWGTVVGPLFAGTDALGTGLSMPSQIGVQVLGVAAAGVWTFGLVFLVARLLQDRWPLRVSPEDELIGLNVSEHGATSDLVDMFRTMEAQAQLDGLDGRVPEDEATEAGQIGRQYNRILDALSDSRSALDTSEHIARQDPLTNTLNRRGLTAALDSLDGRPVTVLMFDVVSFGTINGSLGYSAGDEVLVQVATRLAERLGVGWRCGRWGGDEFVAIADGHIELAPDVVARIVCELSSGGRVGVSLRSGVLHAAAGLEPEAAMRRVSYALDEAKRSSIAIVAFDSVLAHRYERGRSIAAQLDGSLPWSRIFPVGQTLFQDGRIVGVELLARWRNEDGSVEPPASFLSVLVENGLMSALDQHMMAAALGFVGQFDPAVLPWVSVNVSAPSLAVVGFVDRIQEMLLRSNVDPSRLVVEITETEQTTSPDQWFEGARQIRALGVGLAIDDLGSGYSSIDRMGRLPITHVKFDRSMVSAADGPIGGVMESVVDYARDAAIVTVAEGIETEEQHQTVRGLGVDVMQGYLFSRPEPLDAVAAAVVDAAGAPVLS